MDLGRRVRGEVGEIGSDGVGEESELVELRIGGANTEYFLLDSTFSFWETSARVDCNCKLWW